VGSGKSLEYCDLSDIGRRRANNQDAMAVLDAWSSEQFRQRGWLFLVADGMGAHAAGEMASALAAEKVPLAYEKLATRSPPLALRASIQQANTEINARGESAIDLKGMGTTCTVLVIGSRGALVGHVGDSRAYRVRGTRIEQLSADHSLVWEMEAQQARNAEPSPESTRNIPKNIITRSLGPHERVSVDLEGPFPVAEGDAYVVCSDGLSGQVADEEIGVLAAELPPADAAAALLGLALVRGAPDNVTLIVTRTGPKEKTDPNGDGPPWPLTEAIAPAGGPQLPWKPLAAAAAGLLGALLFNPYSGLMEEGGPVGALLGVELARAVGWAAAAAMMLLCVAGLVATALSLVAPVGSEERVLRPGARLGKGPYRSFDCSLSGERVEGIVASVETAADGLSDGERLRALERIAAARRAIAGSRLSEALAEAAGAIAIYRESVISARHDDTIRTGDDA
jgi:serine/threonine protein phosphatase PrpC